MEVDRVTGTSAAGIIVIMAVVLVGAMAMILWIFVIHARPALAGPADRHRPGQAVREDGVAGLALRRTAWPGR